MPIILTKEIAAFHQGVQECYSPWSQHCQEWCVPEKPCNIKKVPIGLYNLQSAHMLQHPLDTWHILCTHEASSRLLLVLMQPQADIYLHAESELQGT